MAEVKLNDPVATQLRQQYPSNSITQPAQPQQPVKQREKVNPVVKGKTAIQKESLGSKIKKMILPGDVKDVKQYLLNNIIIPSAKGGVLSIVEMMLYGQVRSRPSGYNTQRTNYSYSSVNQTSYNRPPITQRDRAVHNFNNIIFETYDDAVDVVETMIDLLERNGVVTVADFYEASRLASDWADVDWGWTRFQKLEPRAIRGGYIIDMTPPVYLKR